MTVVPWENIRALVFLTWIDHPPISCPRWTKMGFAGMSLLCTIATPRVTVNVGSWALDLHTKISTVSDCEYLVSRSPLPHWNVNIILKPLDTLFCMLQSTHLALSNVAMFWLEIHGQQAILGTKLWQNSRGLARFKLSYKKMVRPKVQHAASKESPELEKHSYV